MGGARRRRGVSTGRDCFPERTLVRRNNVTVVEITRVIRGLPSEVALSLSDGMPVDCVINAENLHTIPKPRFRQRIMALAAERSFSLGQALRYALDLEW